MARRTAARRDSRAARSALPELIGVLDADEADRTLAELGAESDRMADALLAMDTHPGQRLLSGPLTGVTRRRWDEASATMTVLWEQFNRHRALLEQAREVRARKQKPGPAELGELTGLLTGTVVELGAEQVPIEQRSLTGPAVVAERVTLTELVGRMKTAYTQVTEVLGAAEKAWDATIARIDPLDTSLRSAQQLAESLGVTEPELPRAAEELADFRRTALTDPLAAGVRPPEQLAKRIEDIRAELEKLARVKESYEERRQRLEDGVAELVALRGEARTVHDTVLEKIAAPGLGPLPDPVRGLSARLGALPGMWREGRWKALSGTLEELDRDVAAALAGLRAQLAQRTGLLDRRLELRGRLDAYRAKAGRLGFAEDLTLAELHRRAHEVLYTIPCDLRAATVAVNEYQKALHDAGTGTEERR
ncbi:hypothetical protein FPZ12_042950 [Amycolatopsis acidicola]|uniref:Uncharacterized protein n=1 Tax=Amycolatopsis acidicola TaxID=2596893 RepID=A0A5N0UPC1_9PSEU|nr:hypothetical protein [Amycolatopsis acidicola]KAA9149618.1 hypothetical protein FPZ12_042950 [Amycolatopsis acidicola]